MNKPNQERDQLTPEQAEKRRKEITEFYKKQMPHLKIQAEYEELMTKIEESRAKRIQAQAFIAEAYMNMEEDSEPATQEMAKEDFEKASKKRKLKVED